MGRAMMMCYRTIEILMISPGSLSDLGNRSEHGGGARTEFHDFEAHSDPTQREIEELRAALPLAQ